MAGGLGKRMNSDLPKVLHQIRGRPMLVHIIEETLLIHPKKIYIIVGKFRNIIQKTVEQYIPLVNIIEYIDQPQALGTGHAIQCAKPKLLRHPDSKVLILSGDVPFIKSSTMLQMLNCNKVKIMTTKMVNPYGYGRIIRDISKNNAFEKIVEEKDCNDSEKKVNEVNCGIYAFESKLLTWNLSFIKNNNSQLEYYLTDIFEIIKTNETDISIETMEIDKANQYQIIGVNTIDQLNELEHMIILSD